MDFQVFIVVLMIGGWLFSRALSKMRLPSILGMVIFGILLGIVGAQYIPQLAWDIEPFVKNLALVIILLRAGLGIKRQALNSVGKTALLMALLPCTIEALVLAPLINMVFGLGWMPSLVAAWMLSAVSPAVVVPSMLEIQEKGIGQRNSLPVLILAAASVDDVVVITMFSVFLGIAVSAQGSGMMAGSMARVAARIATVPFSLIGGIAIGAVCGLLLSWWFSRHHERIRATEKVLLLLGAAFFLLEVGNIIAVAALLGVMTVGFVLLERTNNVASELASKLSKVWIPAEIVLFVYIGMQLDPAVAMSTGWKGLAVICCGLFARSIGVLVALSFDRRFSFIERLFCVVAYLPKATVQAALGAVPLAAGLAGGDVILSLAVIAILFSAPIGLILIRLV
ncbi:MAG: peptidase, partial [Spirochaetaceae bacterium]